MTEADLPFSPAAQRNREPLLAVLQSLLPHGARVLEIASGTGQHAEHCAGARPDWLWQPTEADARLLPAIAARCAALPNVAPPRRLDVMEPACWAALPSQPVQAVFCANLLHIAPWPVCGALMQGAASVLSPDGRLLLYGPFVVDGEPTAPSNLAFDADLRERDPAWGLRRLADVSQQAAQVGLRLEQRIAMPANNRVLVWRR